MKLLFSHSLATTALALGALIGLGGVAEAGVPMTMAHQGRLFDASGFPTEGSVTVEYALFTTASGGTPIWSESETPEVKDGFFASVLGDGTTLTPDLFASETMYLSVTIDGEELLPRTQIVSVPYAMLANDVVGDIHPRSVSIGTTEVIDENGKWIGDPTGLQGPAGAVGPTGAVGPAGADGLAGAMGPVGPQGPQGPQGVSGVAGLACWDLDESRQCDLPTEDRDSSGACDVLDCTGAVGPQGIAGPIGPRGFQGIPGVNGAPGAQGDVGPAGPMGPKGDVGAVGPAGPVGPAGEQGIAGPVGPVGAVGPAGPAGPAGAIGPQGVAGATGAIGPAGPVGAVGATGPTGPQGLVGATGAIGPAGPAGATGPIGPMGPQGLVGATGPAGPTGATGAIGPAGPAGPTGATGATGAIGPAGPVGPTGPSGTGGGTTLTDASGATLGKVLGVGQPVGGSGFTPAHTGYVTIKTSTGHIVSIGMDGLITFGQIYWNGGTCGAGTAIMNSGTATASRKHFCKLVLRSTTGKLYTTGSASCDANGLVDSVLMPGITNIESTGNCSSSSSNQYGWALTEVTNTSIGLPATLTLPLSF